MSRIINLRGTSGSGKSYIVRHIMSLYPERTPQRHTDRRQPLGYFCHRPTGSSLYVLGHYETACGGADTISKELMVNGEMRGGMALVYHLITEAITKGNDVIFEGLIVASDWRRCVELAKENKLLVIGLDTSMDVCLQSIQERRDARGDTRPLSRDNTELKYKGLLSQRKYFRQANGVDFRVLNREDALKACVNFLELTNVDVNPTPALQV